MKPTLLFCAAFFLFFLSYTPDCICQWIHVPTPLGVYCLATHGDDVFAGSFDSSGVWISNDNGASWRACGDQDFVGTYSLAFMGSSWFAGTYEKGVWRSVDSGKSWLPANTGIEAEDIYGLTTTGSNIVAIGLGGIFQSTDTGTTWKRTSDRYAFESSANPLATGGGKIFAATVGGLLGSSDGGATWKTLLDSAFLAVGADDSDVFASNDSGFIRSTDGGNSWAMVSSKQFGLIYLSGKYIFGGPSRGNDVTCFLSSDFGTTWMDLNQGSRSTAIVVSGPNIIKSSNNTGIWYRPLSDFGLAVKRQMQTDLNLSLYPNPTVGSITVQSTSSSIQHVTITNLLGEEVLSLPHPNAAEFTLDLSKLPPGTYFARFSFENEVITRKILKE